MELDIANAVLKIAIDHNYVLVIDHLRENVQKAKKALDKMSSRSPIEGLVEGFFDIVAPRPKKEVLPTTSNNTWLPSKMYGVQIV